MLFYQLSRTDILLEDRSYECDRFRTALRDKGIEPCIPPKKNRKCVQKPQRLETHRNPL